MKVCASYGEVPERPADADFHEVRMDVFDRVPDWAGENTVVTMAGRAEIPLPEDFGGIVDVGDHDAHIRYRMVRSVHDYEGTPPFSVMMFSLMNGGQWLSKYAVTPHSFADLHTIWRAANSTDRRHVVLGMGELGKITRIRARCLNNFFTFGYAGKPTAAGQLSVEELKRLGDGCEVVGIIGNPLGHTLSPVMHDAAMEKAGVDGIYLKFESPDLDRAGEVIREYDIRGVNVTVPYKRDIMDILDSVEGPARTIGAVNTVVNDGGRLTGINTDHFGIIHAFESAGKALSECGKVMVFGTGGASRSAVYAAVEAGCEVYVMGRTPEHVSALCREFGCERAPGKAVSGYGAVINCTPVGMDGDRPYMFDPMGLRRGQAVLDMVYNRKTPLVMAADARGCTVVSGKDMLVGQGAASFERWFGMRPDTDVMRKAVE